MEGTDSRLAITAEEARFGANGAGVKGHLATHAVCPLCGKSSSLRSFPAGSGNDIQLQAFRGLGRGRGFRVIPKGSGFDDEQVRRSVQDKLAAIVRTFEEHGFPVVEAKPIAGLPTVSVASSGPVVDPRRVTETATIRAELDVERATNRFLESELARIEAQLDAEQARLRELATQAAATKRRLARLDRLHTQLVAACAASARALLDLQAELVEPSFVSLEMKRLARNIRDTLRIARELHPIAAEPFRAAPPT